MDLEKCYRIHGITYVPHYLLRGTYVGPGNHSFTESYLKNFGAESVRLLLWPRRYSDL
jgi:hypothetical protein